MTWNQYSLDLEASSSQYAYITDAGQTGLDITGAITIEAWIKLESTGVTQVVATKGNLDSAGSLTYSLCIVSNQARLYVSNGTTTQNSGTGTTLVANKWYHIAGVYVPSTSITTYLNGTQDAQNTTSINSSIQDLTSDSFAIGRDSDGAARHFDGLIDNVMVFNDARSQPEIASDMFDFTPSDANLQGHWDLENDYVDSSGNGNTLTASGSPTFSTNVPWTGANSTDWSNSQAIAADYTKVSGSADLTDFPAVIADTGTGNVISSEMYGAMNPLATGGTITYDGDYTVHTFTADGTFTPKKGLSVEYLVVGGGGGGGGGGTNASGGGGAGGLLTDTGHSVTAQGYSIVVGAGGAGGATTNSNGTNGGDSSFDSIVADGGGGGGKNDAGGLDGGSGGGGGSNSAVQPGGSGTVGQGNDGGDGANEGQDAGGGGGAGAVGGNAVFTTSGGVGGAGTSSSITGSAVTYAGGGGGGSNAYTGGSGGSGGGGDGGSGGSGVTNGTDGLGGGGGGGSTSANGGDGGDGIVIIRYLSGSSDLRITTDSAGTTEVSFEIVSLDTVAETSEIHLKIPTLSYTANTPIYLWAGNANAIAYDANAPFGSQAVWSDYVGVWHLKEASGTRADSTANSATLSDGNTVTSSAGKIGTGADFELTTSEYLYVADTAPLSITGDITITGWVKLEQLSSTIGANVCIVSKYELNNQRAFILLTQPASDNLYLQWNSDGTSGTSTSSYSTGAVFAGGDVGSWVHIAVSLDVSARTALMYKDGSSVSVTNPGSGSTSIANTTAPFVLGARPSSGIYGEFFDGMQDEVKIYSGLKTGDWITTEYNNQNDPSTFWKAGGVRRYFSPGIWRVV